MRHEDLRVLLEGRGHRDKRDALLGSREDLDQIAAHIEVVLAGHKGSGVVGGRSTLHDLDVEAELLVGAVGHGLIVAAMLALGQPVGAEAHLHQVLGKGAVQAGKNHGRRCKHGGLEHAVHSCRLCSILSCKSLVSDCRNAGSTIVSANSRLHKS